MSIARQCALLGLNRSTCYLRPATESEENLRLMRRIDEQDLRAPSYGSRKMTALLRRSGEVVNRKRVRRLMRLDGPGGSIRGRGPPWWSPGRGPTATCSATGC